MSMLPPDPVYIFKGDMGPVFCLALKVVEEDKFLYAGTQTGIVHVWNLKTNRRVGTFESSKDSCIAVYSLKDSNELITQDKAGIICFWKEEGLTWTLIKRIQTDYYGFCRCILFSDKLYTPLKKNHMETISVRTKETECVLNLSENDKLNEIMSFRMFEKNDDCFALVACESCHIYLWSLGCKKKLAEITVDECPMMIDFDAGTMKGVCGSPSEKLVIFSVNKNFQMELKRSVVLTNPGVASLAIRPDGKLLAVGCWDGKLRLYSAKSLTLLAALDVHSSTVQDLVFANIHLKDGKSKLYLMAASKDGKISMWDLYN